MRRFESGRRLQLLALLLAFSCAPRPSTLKGISSAEFHDLIKTNTGKVAVINVWATWCQPCRQEFPVLLRLREKFAPRGLVLFFVTVDSAKDLSDAENFLRSQGVFFRTYYKNEKDSAFIQGVHASWKGSIPATFVFNRKGEFSEYWEGEISAELLEERLAKYFK